MNVDLKGPFVDDIPAFDGLEELFAPNNGTDIFKFCGPDEGHETGVVACATTNLVSSIPSTGLVVEKGGKALTGEWGKEEQVRAGLRVDPQVVQAIPIATKPRARKRQEDDQALERGVFSHPMIKLRASPGCMVLGDLPSWDSGDGLPHMTVSGRSSSFDVAAPLSWNSPTIETRVIDINTSTSSAETVVHTPVHSSPNFAPRKARGGAIKVKKHLLSVSTRPRISVFMSKPRAKPGATPTTSLRTDHSPLFGSVVVPSVASPGNYSLPRTPPTESTLIRSVSANRTKDLRVVVRAPVKTEQSPMEMSPVVVPMGIRRGSTPVVDGIFCPPVLQRATSVGALTLTGDVEAFSRSPRVGPAGGISSYELSEHVQGSAGQRRNLVCKVLGSHLNGPTHPGNS